MAMTVQSLPPKRLTRGSGQSRAAGAHHANSGRQVVGRTVLALRQLLDRQSKPVAVVLSCLLVLGVAMIHVTTSPVLTFSIFYLIPVSFATWYAGRTIGIFMSGVSAVTWLVADQLAGDTYSQPLIHYWNMSVHLGFFLITTLLLAALRDRLEWEAMLARTDPLTRAANRRYFYTLAQNEINRLARYHHTFTVAYIDVDNFKLVNDRFGHHEGDRLLCLIAARIHKALRKNDIVARLGGDEFAILLSETDYKAADEVILKLRDLLQETMRHREWPVTFSIGAITFRTPPRDVDEMIRMADALMYSVKHDGKNRIRHDVSEV